MHPAHEGLIIPPDDTPIWRYLDLPKATSMLQSRSLYFARTSELGDPFEGVLPTAMVRARLAEHDEVLLRVGRIHDQRIQDETDPHRQAGLIAEKEAFLKAESPHLFGQYVRWRYAAVSCWHCSDHESDAMWRVYGARTGIAIRSTVGRLRESIAATEHPVFIAKVEYLDYDAADAQRAGWNDPVIPLFWKRNHFEHERELRCAIYDGQMSAIATHLLRLPGISVPADLDLLVDEVRVAPAGADWFKDAVQAVFERFGLARIVGSSTMDGNHPWAAGGGTSARWGVLG